MIGMLPLDAQRTDHRNLTAIHLPEKSTRSCYDLHHRALTWWTSVSSFIETLEVTVETSHHKKYVLTDGRTDWPTDDPKHNAVCLPLLVEASKARLWCPGALIACCRTKHAGHGLLETLDDVLLEWTSGDHDDQIFSSSLNFGPVSHTHISTQCVSRVNVTDDLRSSRTFAGGFWIACVLLHIMPKSPGIFLSISHFVYTVVVYFNLSNVQCLTPCNASLNLHTYLLLGRSVIIMNELIAK